MHSFDIDSIAAVARQLQFYQREFYEGYMLGTAKSERLECS